jgi:hypothetical protein
MAVIGGSVRAESAAISAAPPPAMIRMARDLVEHLHMNHDRIRATQEFL